MASTTMARVQAIGRLPGITADSAKRRVSNFVLGIVGVGALDVDGDVVRPHFLGQDAELERADADGAADGEVDLAELGDAAVDLDRQPRFGGDAEPGRGDLLDASHGGARRRGR